MKTCQHCKKVIATDAKFCRDCGNPYSEGDQLDRSEQPPARPLRSNGWFWATVALGVVSVILILAIAVAAAEEGLESSTMPTAEVVVSIPTTIPTPVVATATAIPSTAIPTAVATLVPVATVIPTPIPTVVPPPTPGLSTPVPKRGLGVSRRSIEDVFTKPEIGFSFESSPLADGRPRSLAQSPDGVALLEIIGPSYAPTQASLIVGLPDDAPDILALNTLYLLAFVQNVAPGWAGGTDWVMDKIGAMAAGELEARTTTGNLIVEFSLLEGLGVLNLTITAR